MPLKRAGLLFLFFAFFALFLLPSAHTQTGTTGQTRAVFGPETFVRTGGATDVFERAFSVPTYVSGPFTLTVQNGQSDGSNRIEDAISSGSVAVNGVEIINPNDFNQNVAWIDRAVDLSANNTLTVTLNSAPGSFIVISIGGMIELGSLGHGISGHSATIQSDGSVLIFGGADPDGASTESERFDPHTFSFETLSSQLPSAVTEQAASVLADGKTLVTGGTDGTAAVASAVLYNPQTGLFTGAFDSLRYARFGHTETALLDGRVLIAGGQPAGASDRTEAFDAQHGFLFKPPFQSQSGTFIVLPNLLNEPRWEHTATLLPNGKVLITGGKNETGYLSSGEMFDSETEAFTPLSGTMAVPRARHTATLMPDGRVLILGGKNDSGPLASAELFDPDTQSFSPASRSLLRPRVNHTATMLSFGEILITGGEDDSGIIDTAEFYGPPPTDAVAPAVDSISPPDGTVDVATTEVIGIRFSEPMDVTTLNGTGISLSNGEAVACTVTPSEEGLMVYILPSENLDPGATYTISIGPSVTDLAGNPIAPFSSQFTTIAVPIITSVIPNVAVPNAAITINGQNFDPHAPTLNTVRINGFEAVVTSATATQIQTTVPFTAPPGPGGVTVQTSGGSASIFFTVQAPVPVLDSISPDFAEAGSGGFLLTLTGSGFIPYSQVFFGTYLSPASVTPNQIQVEVPDSAVASGGLYFVLVMNPNGRIPIYSNSKTFTVNNPIPTAAALTPSAVPRYSPATPVIIHGEHFYSDTKVRVNGTSQSPTFIDSTTLSILLPATVLSIPQTVAITVENPTPGGGLSDPLYFEVLNPPPVLDGISPTEWTTGYPDLTLAVHGSGFVPESQIDFNGVLIAPETYTPTDLTARIPASALNRVGTLPVEVVNATPGGGASSTLDFNATQAITADPGSLNQGAFHRKLVVSGSSLFPGSTVAFSGSGITVHSVRNKVAYDVSDSRSGGPPFDWKDATGETPLPAGPYNDDSWYTYPDPGFPFYLYGRSDGELIINADGILGIHSAFLIPTNANRIPDPAYPNFYMAPFWDDIGGGQIYTQLLGSAPNRLRVVEWDHFSTCTVTGWGGIGCTSSGNDLTFEAILNEADHSITFQYLSLSGPGADGELATVGIEGNDGLDGTAYLINGLPEENRLTGGLAITFTPTLALELDVSVAPSAETGLRDAIITTPDGVTFTRPGLINITPSPVQIQITSPVSGSQTDRASVLVEGLVPTQSGEIGVVVNGVIAQVSGDRFAANHVPLEPGVNTITAVATDFDGNNTSDSITVNAVDPKDPVLLLANPESGTDPLTVQFSILTDLNANIVSMTLDTEGDGTDDLSFADLSDEPLFTYPHPGLYKATVTLTDDQDVAYTDTIAINVLSLEDLDLLLKARWEGMKGALVSGDIAKGIHYISNAARPKYQRLFERLGNHLTTMASNLPNLQLIRINGDVAVYFIIKVENGSEKAHFVYFAQDEHGQWKLQSF